MTRFFLPVAVHEAAFADANHLAMCCGEGPADAQTWVTASFKDANGQRYAVRALWVTEGWMQSAQGPLSRPEWDTDELVDMEAVARAQAAIRLEGSPAPGLIVCCVETQDALVALAEWGLVQIDPEPDPEDEGE